MANTDNTGGLAKGASSTNTNVWGWVLGGGFEYAVNTDWTTFAEYAHINLPSATQHFRTVTEVNAALIGVKQSIDLFKLGVNYKYWSAVAQNRPLKSSNLFGGRVTTNGIAMRGTARPSQPSANT